MRKILTYVAAALCAASCIYPYTPDIEEAPEGIMAVDGDICIGDISWVRLGPLYSMWPSAGQPVDWWGTNFYEAVVWVEDDAGQQYIGAPYIQPGSNFIDYVSYYNGAQFTIDTSNAPMDRSYRLCINALGEKYVSDWSEPLEAPRIGDISFTADDDNVTVMVSVDAGEHATGYLLLSYDETWEFHADYFPNNTFIPPMTVQEGMTPDGYNEYWCFKYSNDGRSQPVDYTGMTEAGVKDFPLVNFLRTNPRNHKRYCVNVKAKTISAVSYRFLKTLEENTDGGDNLFTPNPGEIAGNLRCETDPERTVLGYVIVSRATTKRAFLDARYLKHQKPSTASLIYLPTDKWNDFYNYGYLPLIPNPNPEYDQTIEGPYGWGPKYCYDCTAAGGTKTRPDFWDE